MRLLILGSGAREHAIAWALSKGADIDALWVGPGNAGTREICDNLWDLDDLDAAAVIAACSERNIDTVFIGPEAPLEIGMADELETAGVRAIGPGRKAAQLECSKSFSKRFMRRHGVPTADARAFSDRREFEAYIRSTEGIRVVKQSGLAAGKGVLESSDNTELIRFGNAILAKDELLVEEFLTGYEVSIFAVLDTHDYLVLPACADYKKVGEGDAGPNTGGMGAICPVPAVDEALMEQIEREVVTPTIAGLARDHLFYRGVLFFGLMVTSSGPHVLEYNVRLGDPESQVLLPCLESDFADLTSAMALGRLGELARPRPAGASLGVVVASGGYPGAYKKGVPVTVSENDLGDALLFHASTQMGAEGETVTGGGRCFTVVGRGNTLNAAREQAYDGVSGVSFSGCFHRTDIGSKFIDH